MAAEGGNNVIVRFTYTGEEGEVIPDNATHVFVDVTTIPARAFEQHNNIVEVICHDRVEKIEEYAFFCFWCSSLSLKRVIMPGVKIAEKFAFNNCTALMDVECDKLEIIGEAAYSNCVSLRSINLPSARIVGECTFRNCEALTDAKFGNKLERMDEMVFHGCTSLERITIPLKDGVIAADNMFMGCTNLKHVDLVEGTKLYETIAALHLMDWRNDMNEEIDSIHQSLTNAHAGGWHCNDFDDYYTLEVGDKEHAIRRWIKSVLDKMIYYKAEHQLVLDVAATALELALHRDIVMNNVLSFLELPPHRFGVEDHEETEQSTTDV
eukprot:CAMPEP_0201717370 /NCGR_PEP_ID=MMETSP0593-20130828/3109_1 /ASSEMBLY_ACC=CAM_ASM_000672 /TAXON_ID=267983 /ORGANISM="Skeletonema japonicum, Strain CCMP2506" /LENGTH=322 /DNA_ID=CAMNT_0048207401 /DNA_START=63 /DNA_END=1031 /DNA_ORIENTATION=+